MMGVLTELLEGILPGLVVGVTMAFWNRRQKDRDKRATEQEQAAVRENTLRLSLLVAAAQLSYAVAMAYRRGRPNGEMEIGIGQYNRAMQAFREFEREQLAKKSKN